MPENQSFGPAGRFIVTGMQISDEGRLMKKAPVKSSQQNSEECRAQRIWQQPPPQVESFSSP